jgi:hypothetical protein
MKLVTGSWASKPAAPSAYSRTPILWNPTHHAWSEAVAAVTDDRHECHTLRFSQGFHARSVAWRETWRKVTELLDLFSNEGVLQLFQKLRVCFRIKTSCSSSD